jgi:hypothetical protein
VTAPYALGTKVDVSASRSELEKTLRRFGADAFGFYSDDALGVQSVGFRLAGRQVRMDLPFPEPGFGSTTPTGKRRTDLQAAEAYEAEVKRRWRSLVLVVKAKLTAVADGITTLEREFLADMVTDNGETVGQRVLPMLANGGTVLSITAGR